jgi:sugar phosphate isomerase/epimerase
MDHGTVRKLLRDNGLTPVSYVRGGFFPALDRDQRNAAIRDNLLMLQEASGMEIPMLVLVCGADPGQFLQVSRDQIRQGIEAILPAARELGIRLAVEPLHPMYADTRSAITSLKQANDLAEYFDDEYLGVAVDVYHLWYDESLEAEIIRCGKNGHIFAYHISDWKTPTVDMLNDRGLMGEGCIPLKRIRGWMEDAGFEGFHEVEIFSTRYWEEDQARFLDRVVDAYFQHC